MVCEILWGRSGRHWPWSVDHVWMSDTQCRTNSIIYLSIHSVHSIHSVRKSGSPESIQSRTHLINLSSELTHSRIYSFTQSRNYSVQNSFCVECTQSRTQSIQNSLSPKFIQSSISRLNEVLHFGSHYTPGYEAAVKTCQFYKPVFPYASIHGCIHWASILGHLRVRPSPLTKTFLHWIQPAMKTCMTSDVKHRFMLWCSVRRAIYVAYVTNSSCGVYVSTYVWESCDEQVEAIFKGACPAKRDRSAPWYT